MSFPKNVRRNKFLPAVAAVVLVTGLTATAAIVLKTDPDGPTVPAASAERTGVRIPQEPVSTSSQPVPAIADGYLSGEVSIGVNGSLPGWSYRDPSTSEYTGFDVDLANYIKTSLGITKITFVPLKPDERESALAEGRVKVVIANFSIDSKSSVDPTRPRTDTMAFAGPYFADKSGILYVKSKVPAGSTIPVKNICVAPGTTAVTALGKAAPVMEQTSCFQAALDPSSDILAAVTDEGILQAYAQSADASVGLAIWAGDNYGWAISDERYGIALPHGHREACMKLNAAIDSYINERWDQAFTENLAKLGSPGGHRPGRSNPDLCA